MFSFVRLSDGGPARIPGARSEVSILSELARRSGAGDGRVDWTLFDSHRAIRELMADLVPGYAGLRDIDATRREFHVPGRNLDEYRFPTADGRAKFHAVDLPAPRPDDGSLRLMTIRSEGQFNSVVYDEEDVYRGQDRRDVILLNPADVARLGLAEDQPVRVRSEAGELRRILVREADIRAGNAAMYYPEANVLVPADVDPLSKTPAFKSVRIEIAAEA
jgi:anaerobic selenocysteine-containing dehydrogenase